MSLSVFAQYNLLSIVEGQQMCTKENRSKHTNTIADRTGTEENILTSRTEHIRHWRTRKWWDKGSQVRSGTRIPDARLFTAPTLFPPRRPRDYFSREISAFYVCYTDNKLKINWGNLFVILSTLLYSNFLIDKLDYSLLKTNDIFNF